MPSLTEVITTVGVTTANSILLIPFARERLAEGIASMQAALEVDATRLRSVLMTVLAMIIDMVPMTLGLGKSAEQNVPSRRVMIGSLLPAIVSTFFSVLVVFTNMRNRLQRYITRCSQDLRGSEGHV